MADSTPLRVCRRALSLTFLSARWMGSGAGIAALLLVSVLSILVAGRIDAGSTGPALVVPKSDSAFDFGIAITALLSGVIALAALAQREARGRALARANAELLEAQLLAQIGHWDYVPALDRFTWSLSLCRMFGRDPAKPVSRLSEIRRYVPPDDERKVRTAIDHVMRTGEQQEIELAVHLPDRSRRIRQIIVAASRGRDGVISGVHGTGQDITDIKRLESLEAKLNHLSRLDAMNLMAGTLAHEVSQPLTSAINYLAVARREIARADWAGRDAIDEVVRLSETQVHIAGEILRSIRGMVSSRSDMKAVEIGDAWQQAVSIMRGMHRGRRMLFGQEIAGDAALVHADALQIRQVLANLIGNAIEAVPPDRAPAISLVVRREGEDRIAVSVRDNGVGLGDIGDNIFSPFATTKADGLGLGLVLSRTIIEAHGGRIWIEKTDANGTSIGFTLRIAPLVTERVAKAAS